MASSWSVPPHPVSGFSQVPQGAWRPPKRPPTRAPRSAPPPRPTLRVSVDPFAPRPDAALRSQAQSEANSQTSPLLQQLQQAIEARSQSGSNAIGGYTKSLEGLFSNVAPQTAGIYNQAIQAQSGVNSELANRLGNFGQQQQQQIGNKLAYAGPSGQSVASNAGLVGQGAANAGFAKGAAETSMLRTQGAAAQAYGAQLPGIAGLTGLQTIKHLQNQLSQEFADKAGQISAHAQDLFGTIYNHLLDQEWQKTLAKQSGQFKSQTARDKAYNQSRLDAYRQATLAWHKAQAAANNKLKARGQNITVRGQNITVRGQDVGASTADKNRAATNARAAASRAAALKRAKIAAGKKAGYALIPPKGK